MRLNQDIRKIQSRFWFMFFIFLSEAWRKKISKKNMNDIPEYSKRFL